MISVHFLFNKVKQTFSSAVYAILQCKKTDILEPKPNRTMIVLEPEQNRT